MKENIQENLNKEVSTEQENLNIMMALIMKENGMIAKCMEKENYFKLKIKLFLKEILN